MANVVGSLLIKLGMNIAEFDKGMNKASKKLNKFGRNAKRHGDMLTRNVTMPLLAAGTAAVKFAADYESAFAGVRKTVDATAAEYQALSDGIRKMSTEIPVSAVAIAGVAEAAGQLGIAKSDLLDFTRIMVDLGNTTDIEAKEAAIGLARVASITQMSADNYDRLGSSVVDLGNKYEVFESEIVEAATRMAGSANVARMNQAELVGLAAAYRSVGIEAALAGSTTTKTVAKMKSAVLSGGKELDRFGRIAGMTGEQFKVAFEDNAADAIAAFIEGLQRIDQEGGNVYEALASVELADIRVTNTLITLAGAGDKVRRMLNTSRDAWQKNVALTDEARKRYETFTSKLTIFWNKLKDIAIDSGTELIPKLEEMLPLLERLTGVVGTILDKFAALPTEVQIGLLVAGPALSAAGSVAQIGAALARLPGWAKLAGLAVLGAGAAFGVLKNKSGEATEELEVHLEIVKTIDETYRQIHGQLALLMHAVSKSIGGGGEAGESASGKIGNWLKNWVKKFEGFEDYIQSWGDNIADVFAQGIVDGDLWAKKWSDWIDSIVADLARLIAQLYITQPLVQALQGALGLPTTAGATAAGPGDVGYDLPTGGWVAPAGVDNSTGGVTIENHATGLVDISTQRKPGGGLRVMVESIVLDTIGTGKADKVLGQATGGRRQPRRR